jgi:hypothetical protein
MEGFIKYAVEMGSDAMIKNGSVIQHFRRRDTRTHRRQGDGMSLPSYFKIRKVC